MIWFVPIGSKARESSAMSCRFDDPEKALPHGVIAFISKSLLVPP